MDNATANGPNGPHVAFGEGWYEEEPARFPGEALRTASGSQTGAREQSGAQLWLEEDSVPSEEASQMASPPLPAWQCGPCSLHH